MADAAVIYCRRSDPNTKSNDPRFEDQEARNNVERDRWLEGIANATDPMVVQALVEKAEKSSKEAAEATAKLLDARKELDTIDKHKASYIDVVDRLARVTDIHTMTTEEQRVLLDLIGLKVRVSPPG